MDAALEVFAESGFASASLELISERAGMTRGAFYYNFASKEELFLAVINREFEDVLRVMPSVKPEEVTVDDLLVLFSSLFSIRVNEFIAPALISEEFRLQAMRDPEAARKQVESFTRTTIV